MTTAAGTAHRSGASAAGAVTAADSGPASTAGEAAAPWGLLLGSVVLALAVVPAVLLLPHDRVSADTTLPFAGWLAVGVAGAVALERPRWRRTGTVALMLAFVPAGLVVAGSAGAGEVAGALWSPAPVWPVALTLLAVSTWRGRSRDARRWRVWITLVAGAASAAWVLAVAVVDGPAVTIARAVAVIAVIAVAATVVAAAVGQTPRPVDEPLLDLGLALGVMAVAVASGAALRAFAQSQVINGADVQAVVAGAVVLGLAVPGALRIRREVLARRSGPGVLPDADVAALTADLGVVEDPRSLLPQAARMVATAGGVQQARIVLETDPIDPTGDPPDDVAGDASDDVAGDHGDDRGVGAGAGAASAWLAFPLVASGHQVGTLQVLPRKADGLESRNLTGIARLLPTLALVVRAVGLALDAQDSRSDLARQRELERARILQDLHDDLGPALAGMSMRVRAARAQDPSELLETLEAGLAGCRADLRRVVAGLTPPVLSSGDTATALTALVTSFQSTSGPRVSLEGTVPERVDADAAVVLYRCVAEGLTNAVRHADAQHVLVRVRRTTSGLVATVEDDGNGNGLVVPGVGLTSLRSRARELGGHLRVEARDGGGTALVVELPERSGSPQRRAES